MRLFKLLLTMVMLFLIAIFVYQNMQTWRQLISFKLNLYVFETSPAKPPSIELYWVILLSALGGFIIGMWLMLKPYFKTRRLLKRERQERKQAREELTLSQAKAESHGEAAESSAGSSQAAGSEKEE